MKEQITLKVNGETHDVEMEANRLLLHVLRDNLGLTGTKEGCSMVFAALAASSSTAA